MMSMHSAIDSELVMVMLVGLSDRFEYVDDKVCIIITDDETKVIKKYVDRLDSGPTLLR